MPNFYTEIFKSGFLNITVITFMRLTVNKIKEVMVSILGEEGLPLVDQLSGKENVSEFELATKTKKDIKVVRRILYILYNHSLVSFIRKKDKNKGWYIYYWTLLPEGIRFMYVKKKRELLQKLQTQLEEELKELFFVCPNKCVRLNFDQSMDFEFHCPECGQLITQDSTQQKIVEIKRQVQEITEELKILDWESKKDSKKRKPLPAKAKSRKKKTIDKNPKKKTKKR